MAADEILGIPLGQVGFDPVEKRFRAASKAKIALDGARPAQQDSAALDIDVGHLKRIRRADSLSCLRPLAQSAGCGTNSGRNGCED